MCSRYKFFLRYMQISSYFSHSVDWEIVSFGGQKLLILIQSYLPIFSFVIYTFDVICRKLLFYPRSQKYTPHFILRIVQL